ncbi:MAG: EAL domain-containing protein [Burkholderiaceae bacterium]|nr:EAL domain-containing protein [Burkholderiaceae bacterium]
MTRLLNKLIAALHIHRIGVRLALSYGVLLILFIISAVLTSGQIRKLTSLSERFARNDIPRLLTVQAISLSTETASNALLMLLTAPKQQRITEYQQVDERNREIGRLISSLELVLKDPEQLQTLQRLIERRTAYQKAYIETVEVLEETGQEAAKDYFILHIQPSLSALLNESNALLQRERESVQKLQAEAQADLEQTSFAIAVISLVAVFVAAILAWLTTRSVARPMAILETSALQIAAGNYGFVVPKNKTEEVERVGQAINTMASAIATREKEIEQLAYYDPITHLPNRTLMLRDFGKQMHINRGLLLMDLARLKTVNETLGFDTGDAIIKETANRIADVLHALDTNVAPFFVKFSGGSFVILCAAREKDAVEYIRNHIDQALAMPIRCTHYTVDVSLVYGMAIACKEPATLVTLLRNAEVALYAAKRTGATSAWYTDAQEASRLIHLSLLSDLRLAVRESALQLWLQPKVRLQDQTTYGFEALVRWQHPERGFISPADFIPFAERTGYIGIITQWMLESAISMLASWKTDHPKLSIAVNVSTVDLRDPNFPQRVKHLLEQFSVDPKLLKLEITESGIMEDPANAIKLLHSIRDTGIGLSIDDFGTGHSSLSYLQRLPVDELKIDRSFVININDQPATQRLVKTIIEMGHGLGLHVIAEGIETEAERDTMRALGCDAMQGYLSSRPLFGANLQNWLNNLAR